MRIGAGSTADYRTSEPITARQRFLLNEVCNGIRLTADFLVHRCDAEFPTARGLCKCKVTKKGAKTVLPAIFLIVQGTTGFYELLTSIENLKLRNGQGILNCAPNLIPPTPCFRGKGNYVVFAKCAFDASQALPQFVVRKLIGFRGNY